MSGNLPPAEQREAARILFRERMAISASLAEEITRRMSNDLVRLLLAETAHVRTEPIVVTRVDPDELDVDIGGADEILDIPELIDEPPELNANVPVGVWVKVTITDPISVKSGKVRVRGICLDQGKAYRFWDEFNTDLSVAMTRFRKLRVAAELDPTKPVRRGELLGAAVLVKYETRDSGKVMVQDYYRISDLDVYTHGKVMGA